MFKKGLALLLFLCLLSGAWGTLAQDAPAQEYAHIDQLPYLVEGRPDMALPEPLTITTTSKLIRFAPASGKNEYKEAYVAHEDSLQLLKAKWSSKDKAYVLDHAKAGIIAAYLGNVRFLGVKVLKNDRKISKQISERQLGHFFRADTGICISVEYLVQLKTKAGPELYSLAFLAETEPSHYSYQLNGETVGLFDRAGQRIFSSPVAAPATPDQIPGLPDMRFPSIRYRWPWTGKEPFRVEADASWDEVSIAIQAEGYGSVDFSTGRTTNVEGYNHTVRLSYHQAEGAWLSKSLNSLSTILGDMESNSPKSVVISLISRPDQGSTVRVLVPLSTNSIRDLSMGDHRGFETPQPTLDGNPTMLYTRQNEYGYTELKAETSKDNLHVSFFDIAGSLKAERDYPMSPWELPRGIEYNTQAMALEALDAKYQMNAFSQVSAITKHPIIVPPDWEPTFHIGKAEWKISGVHKDYEYISIWYPEIQDGEISMLNYQAFSEEEEPALRGEVVERIVQNSKEKPGNTFLEFRPRGSSHPPPMYGYDFTKNKWAYSKDVYRIPGESGLSCTLKCYFEPVGYVATFFTFPQGGEWKNHWTAEYDHEGNLIPEFTEIHR